MNPTPFHPLTNKKIGDRVKIPKNPLDESLGFDYGTIHHISPSDDLCVVWDHKTPFLARRTSTLCCILV
jgi:hypothetical protein